MKPQLARLFEAARGELIVIIPMERSLTVADQK